MADVILKNASGQDVTYEGVDNVALMNTDGAIETFVSERLIQNQIQADWNQTDETAVDYIKNKPETFEAEDELPEVTAEDDGKLLGVLNGIWQKVDAPEGSGSGEKELPEVTTDDNGKVLKVVNGLWSIANDEVGTGSGTGGGSVEQVQVDWNENDESSVAYIKNRPFGMGAEVLTEMLPETTLPFTLTNMSAFGFETTPMSEQLEAWNTNWSLCRVVYDGVTYDCEPQMLGGIKCCGNIEAFMGTGSNNMPFVFAVGDIYGTGDIAGVYSVVDTAESTHSIAISLTLQEIKKLDPKFLENIDYETQIINKPFYTILSGTVLLDATIDCNMEVEGLYAALVDEIDIIDGATYYVEIDGTSYSVAGEAYDGGASMMYESDDMFFAIVNGYYPNQSLIALPTQGEHTCKITVSEDAVKKIDAQYLPDLGSGLPESTTVDSGKVLTVGTDGTAVWSTPASGLPEVTATDDGKVLKVVGGAWAVRSEQEIPASTTDDNGKFLRIVDGAPAWVALTDVSQEGA